MPAIICLSIACNSYTRPNSQATAESIEAPSSAGGAEKLPLSASASGRSARMSATSMALAAASHAVLTPGGPLPQPAFAAWRDGSTSRRSGGGGGGSGRGSLDLGGVRTAWRLMGVHIYIGYVLSQQKMHAMQQTRQHRTQVLKYRTWSLCALQVHPDDKVAAHRALKRLRALTGQGTAFPGAADAPGGGASEGQGPKSSLSGRLHRSDAGSSSSLGSGWRGEGPPGAGLGSGPLGSGPLGSGPLAATAAAQAEGAVPSTAAPAALRWMGAAGLNDASLAARGVSPTSSWGRSVTRGPDKHRALFEAFESMRNDGCDPCDEAERTEHAGLQGSRSGVGSGVGSERPASGQLSSRGTEDAANAGAQRRLARIASGVPAPASVQSWPRRVAHGVEERPSIFGAFPEVAARLDRGGPRAGPNIADQASKPSAGSAHGAARVPPQLPPGPTPSSTQSWRRGVVLGAERRRSVLDVFGGPSGASSPSGKAPSPRVTEPAGAASSTDTWPRAVAAASRPPLGALAGGSGLGIRVSGGSSGSLSRLASSEHVAGGVDDRSAASGLRVPGRGLTSSLGGLEPGDPAAAGPSYPTSGTQAHAAEGARSDARARDATASLVRQAPGASASLSAGAVPPAQRIATAKSAPGASGTGVGASERGGLVPDPGFHGHTGLRAGGMLVPVQGLAPSVILAAGPEPAGQVGGGRASSERRPSLFDVFPEMRGGGGGGGGSSHAASYDVENPRFPGASAPPQDAAVPQGSGALQGPRGSETLHSPSGPTSTEHAGGLPGVPAATPALEQDRQASEQSQAGLAGDPAPLASQQRPQLGKARRAGAAPPARQEPMRAGSEGVEQGAGAAAKDTVPPLRAPLFGGGAPESEETWAAGDTRTHTLAQVGRRFLSGLPMDDCVCPDARSTLCPARAAMLGCQGAAHGICAPGNSHATQERHRTMLSARSSLCGCSRHESKAGLHRTASFARFPWNQALVRARRRR